MEKIENLQQYEEAEKRVEELLPLISDDMPTDDPNYIEFVRLSNMVADYSEEHFLIKKVGG
jgi:HTH-type transcriptional regulator/antitoxin HigA